jgi:hypothetical protein
MTTSGVNGSSYTGGTSGVTESGKSGGPKSPTDPNKKIHARTMEELKKEAPDVYEMTLKGIAQNMCTEFKHHSDKLIQEMKKHRVG